MKKLVIYSALLLGLVTLSNTTVAQKTGSNSLLIGTQIWMTKNLNVSTFRNGDKITEVRDYKEWQKAGETGKPAWCYPNFDTTVGKKYGKLYNWHAVHDPRGLAPKGWHVASDSEWTVLSDFLGGNDAAGQKLKNKTGWKQGDNGTNESGFSAMPAGYRYIYGYFYDFDNNAYWWTSTETGKYDAWYRGIFMSGTAVSKLKYDKGHGFSVRCIKD